MLEKGEINKGSHAYSNTPQPSCRFTVRSPLGITPYFLWEVCILYKLLNLLPVHSFETCYV